MPRIQLRRGTAAQWTTADPVLAPGEVGVETDTGYMKVGNGTDPWTVRPYQQGPTGAPGTDGATAYQLAVANGFVGTEAEWLASLASTEPGPQGPPGQGLHVDGRVATYAALPAAPAVGTALVVDADELLYVYGEGGWPADGDGVALGATAAQLAAKADLVAGKIPQAQIPAVAITEYLGAVASQAAMLALTGQRGDWCTRTDLGTDWQLTADDATQLSSWREHTHPASPVQSVAGRTGAVTLTTGDLGDMTTVGVDLAKAATAAAGRAVLAAVAGADNAGARALTVWVGTEAQYTALGTKDPNTLYFRTA